MRTVKARRIRTLSRKRRLSVSAFARKMRKADEIIGRYRNALCVLAE